jgi:hypothetical protein
MKTILTRLEDDGKQTLGILQVFDGIEKIFECKTLELGWHDNVQKKSCILSGTYTVLRHTSPKFGNTFHVTNVPGRSEILIHHGNYQQDTTGCILVGQDFADIDKNGTVDITYSKHTMNKLLEVMPDIFELKIL